MKKFIFIGLIAVLLFQNSITYAEQRIPADQSSYHIGEYVTVCGMVAQFAKLKKRTILNIGDAYPNEDINFLIWDNDIHPFNTKFGSLNKLANRNLCATEKIVVYKGHPEIILKNPGNLN